MGNCHNWWKIFSISSGNMQIIEEENALVMPAILLRSPVLKSRLTSSCKRTINRPSFSISRKKCKFVDVKCSVKKVIIFVMTSTHRRNSQNHLLHNNHQVSQTRPIQPKQIAILHPPVKFSQWIMPAILLRSPILKSRLTSSCKRTINRPSFSISRKKNASLLMWNAPWKK